MNTDVSSAGIPMTCSRTGSSGTTFHHSELVLKLQHREHASSPCPSLLTSHLVFFTSPMRSSCWVFRPCCVSGADSEGALARHCARMASYSARSECLSSTRVGTPRIILSVSSKAIVRTLYEGTRICCRPL